MLLTTCTVEKGAFNGQLVNKFPPPTELEGTRILEKEHAIVYLNQIDSLIVVSTERDTIFHIYDKNENYITGFGQKGRGPNEFVRAPVIEDIIKQDNIVKAFAYDGIRKELVTINMTTSIDSSKLIVEKRLSLPIELRGAFDFFHINNKTLLGIYDDRFNKQLDERRGGYYYYPKLDTFKTFPLFNLKIRPYEIMPAMNINARMPAVSPDRGKLAVIMMHYPGLEIFDIKSHSLTRYLLDPNPPRDTFDLKAFKKGEVTEYYPFIYSTNSYIYLLYTGHTASDYKYETKIQIMDWNGNPHAQYLIPAKYALSMFVVDEKNQHFYGLSYPNDAIYKFDYGE